MSLEARLVDFGFMLLAGRPLSIRQTTESVNLYGSKQELVAHLLTREDACRSSEAIVAELVRVAQANYTASQTVRPGFVDHRRRRDLQCEMVSRYRDAVLKVVALEQPVDAAGHAADLLAESREPDERPFGSFAPFVRT